MGRKSCAMAVALAACLLGGAMAEARTLRWARSMDVTSLDPHAANTGPHILIAHQIYEPLIVRQLDGWMVPALATYWTFTGEDVVFSIERARADTSDMKSLLSSVESVSIVDDLTVRIKTKGPDPLLPNNLTDIFIMDRGWCETHGVTRVPDPKAGQESFTAANSNGTGPYALVSRQKDSQTVLRRNEGYWGRTEFPLGISELVYRPIPDNAQRIAALLSGDVDFVQDVPVDDIQRLSAVPGIRLNTGPENRSIFLGLNVGGRELASSDIKGRNPFADRHVREAISMALDREAIRRTVMRGQSVPAGVIVPPFSNGYSRDLDRPPPFDQGKARALLREAGYPDGFSVALHCTNDR